MNTFGGYAANRADPGWQGLMTARLNALLEEMVRLGLVELEGSDVQLTLLGRACGESSLAFRSAMRLVELVRGLGAANLTAERLMAIVQALPESDNGYTPMFKKGRRESVRPEEAAQRFGQGTVHLLQRYVDDTMDYYARCKRASILHDWIEGRPVDEIERSYTITPFQGKISYGDIRRFADATRFHMRAAHQITEILFIENGLNEAQVENVLKRLEAGLPEAALPLLQLRTPLARGEYLALLNSGLSAPEGLWALTNEELVARLGEALGRRITAMRPEA